ncbi:MAG TPA: hypothetical protein PLL57_12165 [Flavobacteriales bacterium]|nr:hypothetical protein [Flavobacteriales bacterium]
MPTQVRHKFTRLRGYDYAQGGAYFVTINTHDRGHLFGRIVPGTTASDTVMEPNDNGRIVQECWDAIPAHFPGVFTDAFQMMPNHVHGVVVIGNAMATADDPAGRCGASTLRHHEPNDDRPRGSKPRSLSAIVGSFKSAAAKRINQQGGTPGAPVWQHNYHDRIIRDAAEHERIAQYIFDNPANWANDPENR